MTKPFAGVINVDIRDSVPDWSPFEPPRAPAGAPNVVYIVLDDVGYSAMSCYGGPIETPNIDRVAREGLRYTQWHTTALCSPTRSCLPTGRNHARNSMACITEAAVGFPNASGTIPPENGMLSEILGEQGWNTYMVGKSHLCPTVEMNVASTRRNWPSGRGFERWYGFLGAETNQWYPDLVYDNHPVDQPKSPEQGYHLTEDLTDKAIEFIKDAKAVAPDKPYFLYYAPGAAHAPHHVSKDWADKFKGRFDMGYEAMREQTLARQKQMGIVPADTELPPVNPIGWAMALNTPFRMWKRYEFNGGTADPCIISWPSATAGHGEIRHQYHHAVDIVPTILDVLGIEAPAAIKGHVQSRLDGVSMRYSVADPSAPSARKTQFYSMLGSRGIWHYGWKAVTTHPTISGWSDFNDDTWELYHTDTDRSEMHDLAAEHPDKLRELVNLWFAEAGANQAFPLDDRSAVEIMITPRPQLASPRDRYVYFPGTAEVPEAQAVNVRNRSYTIGALVDIPAPGAEGVLFAHGSRFGGHALYVKDNRLHYVNNFVGMAEQKIDGTQDLPAGENLILSASFAKDGEDPPHVSTGILSLYHGDKKVGEGRIKTQPGQFMFAGEGLCVGRDSGEAVTDDYPNGSPHHFTGGTIKRVAVDVSGDPYVDLEREAQAMLMRE